MFERGPTLRSGPGAGPLAGGAPPGPGSPPGACGAVLGAVTTAVALAVGLPAALAGSPGSRVVHVVGPGPSTSTPAPTTRVTSIPGGGGVGGVPTATPSAQLRGSDTQPADDFGAAVAVSRLDGAGGGAGPRRGPMPTCSPARRRAGRRRPSCKAPTPPPGTTSAPRVAISGSTALVGAPGHGGGRTYVFIRTEAGWTQTAELKGSDTAQNDGFGTALALSAATLVVGAPATPARPGGCTCSSIPPGGGSRRPS